MAIPDYQTLMLPALTTLGDSSDHSSKEVIARLADEYHLTDEERALLLPSGRIQLVNNRVHWAVTYLRHAGLVESVRKGVWHITAEGVSVLAEKPQRIDVPFLRRYPQFVAWQKGTAAEPAQTAEQQANRVDVPLETPEEILERTWTAIRTQVAEELLDAVRGATPTFFEHLVVRLLVAMGYGGSYAEAARVIGRTGDGGIDGVIKEDRLGLSSIYIQAKKWEATIGRPELQKFAGSLEGEHAQKGVFLTTSLFSSEAREYVKKVNKQIALIDGAELAALMIEHGVGVVNDRQYVVPGVDAEFFSEE
jgi:restriction system protein